MRRIKWLLFGLLLFFSFSVSSQDLPPAGNWTPEQQIKIRDLALSLISENEQLRKDLLTADEALKSSEASLVESKKEAQKWKDDSISLSGMCASLVTKLESVSNAQILSSESRTSYELSLVGEIELQKRNTVRISTLTFFGGLFVGYLSDPLIDRLQQFIRTGS